MPAVHQLVAGYTHGDAISNEARVMRRIFCSWGFDSQIFCETRRILPELRGDAIDLSECLSKLTTDDVLLLHMSVGSVANEVFRNARCRKALLYHNITPPHYFAFVNPQTAAALLSGRRDLELLSGVADINMADTRFNAAELEQIGYHNVETLPLVLDFAALSAPGERATRRRLTDGLTNILFVGRCAPNKRVEDIVDAFCLFQRNINPQSRLIHVGSYAGAECYHHLILARCRELGLRNVFFPGAIPQTELNAYYETAHVFLCMSEHEGFCIPLIESMHFGLPVLAYQAAAVPETMDGSGVMFREKRFAEVAAMMGEMAKPGAFRDAIINSQKERLQRFRDLDIEALLRGYLNPILPHGANTSP